MWGKLDLAQTHGRIQDPCCSSARGATEAAAGLSSLGLWHMKRVGEFCLSYSLYSLGPVISSLWGHLTWKGGWRVHSVFGKRSNTYREIVGPIQVHCCRALS